MKEMKGNLVLTKDTVFGESIRVSGNILCQGGAWDLVVKGSITAMNISAWDITAESVSAGDITAGDISAWDITAGDISYYASCIAYGNIRCKSIRGRRKNSFHKALDGKVEIEN